MEPEHRKMLECQPSLGTAIMRRISSTKHGGPVGSVCRTAEMQCKLVCEGYPPVRHRLGTSLLVPMLHLRALRAFRRPSDTMPDRDYLPINTGCPAPRFTSRGASDHGVFTSLC
jgi:hypothetical protein